MGNSLHLGTQVAPRTRDRCRADTSRRGLRGRAWGPGGRGLPEGRRGTHRGRQRILRYGAPVPPRRVHRGAGTPSEPAAQLAPPGGDARIHWGAHRIEHRLAGRNEGRFQSPIMLVRGAGASSFAWPYQWEALTLSQENKGLGAYPLDQARSGLPGAGGQYQGYWQLRCMVRIRRTLSSRSSARRAAAVAVEISSA